MKYLSVFFVFLCLLSCKKDDIQDEIIIIRIGTVILTENDVVKAIGNNATPEQKLNFIQNWSDKELAYQAALSNGLDKDENTKRILKDMEKSLLSAQFIQREVGKSGSVEISADEIENEFRQNPQNYIRKEPVVRVAKIITATRTDAWKARENMTAENFRIRGNIFSIEKIPPFEEIKFTPKSDFNGNTFNVIFGSRISSVTLPIEEDGTYSIYLILDKEDAGSPALLEEVGDEVKRNIYTKKQNRVIRDIYTNLRNRQDYSYDREYIVKLENQQKLEQK